MTLQTYTIEDIERDRQRAEARAAAERAAERAEAAARAERQRLANMELVSFNAELPGMETTLENWFFTQQRKG